MPYDLRGHRDLLASADATQEHFQIAESLIDQVSDDLLTTDYVIDEALTVLRARRRATAAELLGERFFAGLLANIHYVEEPDVMAAWQVFRRFKDKEWSFTDCVSYAVMQRLQIETALSFDHHFRQFGTVAVLP